MSVNVTLNPTDPNTLENTITKMVQSLEIKESFFQPEEKVEKVFQEIGNKIGQEKITKDFKIRKRHGKDLTWHKPKLPDLVTFPTCTEDIQNTLKICNQHVFPVVPFGVGSSLEGHILPLQGGLTLNTHKMNQILSIHPNDGDCVVQCGATRGQVNKEVQKYGLFFSPDPGADATLGGLLGTCASGPTAMRYGTVATNVLSLKAVLPDGTLIKTGQRARKTCAGYDLTRLFIGSEGTLGVICEATLRLHRNPKYIEMAVLVFPDIASAVKSVVEMTHETILIARIEILDSLCMKAINNYSKVIGPRHYSELPTLLVEIHGTKEAVRSEVDQCDLIAKKFNACSTKWSSEEKEIKLLWEARYHAWYACPLLRPEAGAFATDVAVPMVNLTESIVSAQKEARDLNIIAPIIGHVGSGNFHCFLLVDMKNEQEIQSAKEFIRRLVKKAQLLEGTCTGEHGVALGKKKFLVEELGEETVQVMKLIKRAFDPNEIMNPGKIF